MKWNLYRKVPLCLNKQNVWTYKLRKVYCFKRLWLERNDWIWLHLFINADACPSWHTVETPYSTIPYTTIFYITRWTHGPQNLQRPIRTLIVLLGFWIKKFSCDLFVYCPWRQLWMSPHVARCRCQQWRQDRLPQTFTPYDPSRWSQLSSQVHSQRIGGFLASYSADSNAWSNNFNTIFWSDEPTSDASGSWLPVVLNRQHNTKQKEPWVGCLQLTCHN